IRTSVSRRRDRHDGGPFLAAGLHECEEEHQEREHTLGGHVIVVDSEPVVAIAHSRGRVIGTRCRAADPDQGPDRSFGTSLVLVRRPDPALSTCASGTMMKDARSMRISRIDRLRMTSSLLFAATDPYTTRISWAVGSRPRRCRTASIISVMAGSTFWRKVMRSASL